jgi:hypothetical protein
LAKDPKHKRNVALKMIEPEPDAGAGRSAPLE